MADMDDTDQLQPVENAVERLVTMTEIAELAGVHRPAVSNWRRRHRGFPHPVVEDGSQPLFEPDEVATWLDERPIPGAMEPPKTYGARFRDELRIRAVMKLRVGGMPGDRLLSAAVALCTLRHITHKPAEDVPIARRFAEDVERGHPDLAGVLTADINGLAVAHKRLVRAVDEMCKAAAANPDDPLAADPVAVAERLLSQADRLGSGLRAATTPKPVADFVAELAGDVNGLTVYDPAAGFGALLLRMLQNGKPRRLIAAEFDGATFRLMRQRFILHEVAVEAHRQDSLRSGTWQGADLVVLDPPFVGVDDHPTVQRGLFTWLRYAQGQLAFGGRALLVLPIWTLSDDGGRSRLFARQWEPLLKSGVLRAIIQLPRRVHSFRTGTELAVAVLERSQGSAANRGVMLCHGERGPSDPAQLARVINSWLSGEGRGELPHLARQVSAEEAIRKGSLLPSRFLAAPIESGPSGGKVEVHARRLAALPALGEISPPAAVERRAPHAHRSIEELIRDGRLEMLPGRRLANEEIGDFNGIEVLGPPELTGSRRVGSRSTRLKTVGRMRHSRLTVPGDVVILPGDPPRVLVDSDGGRVVQAPAQILRIRGDWCTPRVMAAIVTAPRNAVRASGSLVRRVDLTTFEVPDIPDDEMRRVDQALRMLDAHRQQAADRLSALDDAIVALGAGVADGLLSVDGSDNGEMRERGGTA